MKKNEQIIKYLLGELGDSERAEFEINLENDHELKKTYLDYKRSLKSLRGYSSVEENELYYENLKYRIFSNLKPKRNNSFKYKLSYAFPLAILIFFLFISLPVEDVTIETLLTDIENTEAMQLYDIYDMDLVAFGNFLANEDTVIQLNDGNLFSELEINEINGGIISEYEFYEVKDDMNFIQEDELKIILNKIK